MWYATHYVIDDPSSTMIFNSGQSDHFGYYKRVSMWTTAYDSDLTAELSNPEMVQLGALDFSFVWLYLMPLLLVVLTYHTKGLEKDLGFLPLLQVQQPNLNSWLAQRLAVIGMGILILLSLLILSASLLVGDLSLGKDVFTLWVVYSLYLILWLVIIYLIIKFGKGQADQALKMVGVWLLLTIVMPGIVNQYILLKKPADLMMDMIEASRDGQSEIFDRPKEAIIEDSKRIMPELVDLEVAKHDSLLSQDMINGAYRLVLNEYMSEVSNRIMQDQMERNKMIAASYWFNPVTGFHNWLNNITKTGHKSNLDFRKKIQKAGEVINQTLIKDEWSEKKMDKSSFEEYSKLLE
jgi:ABC-2 type transport system permease protein